MLRKSGFSKIYLKFILSLKNLCSRKFECFFLDLILTDLAHNLQLK